MDYWYLNLRILDKMQGIVGRAWATLHHIEKAMILKLHVQMITNYHYDVMGKEELYWHPISLTVNC